VVFVLRKIEFFGPYEVRERTIRGF
jgi:hypothetical protein